MSKIDPVKLLFKDSDPSSMVPFRLVLKSSPVARRILLHLFTLNQAWITEKSLVWPFTKPGVGLTWIRAGKGHLWLGDRQWTVEPDGSFWFYGTDKPRIWVPQSGKGIQVQAIWFGGRGAENWLREIDSENQPRITVRKPEVVYQAFRKMVALAHRCPPEWEFEVHLLLTSVLREILRAHGLLTPAESAIPEPIAKALNAVASNPLLDHQASQLANIAGMSYSVFNALFNKTMNETPHGYLLRTRLESARHLLASSDHQMKEIASMLHFKSKHTFSRFFHRYSGISPTEYRKLSGTTPKEAK